jgi:hypothetical protein
MMRSGLSVIEGNSTSTQPQERRVTKIKFHGRTYALWSKMQALYGDDVKGIDGVRDFRNVIYKSEAA